MRNKLLRGISILIATTLILQGIYYPAVSVYGDELLIYGTEATSEDFSEELLTDDQTITDSGEEGSEDTGSYEDDPVYEQPEEEEPAQESPYYGDPDSEFPAEENPEDVTPEDPETTSGADGTTTTEETFEQEDAKYDHLFPGALLIDEYEEELEEEEEITLSSDEIDALLESEEYADIAAFPAGYQAKLIALKQKHPNWTFKAVDTGLDFEDAVASEYGDRSWIYINDSNKENGYVGDKTGQTNWAYATKKGIRYYMDPRNFLTQKYIFQFEQLTYNSNIHTVDVIQNFLSNTFMKGKIPGDSQNRTYAQAFYTIGIGRKISPTHLAARVYQEQGKGTSPLISGDSGYYNYFNVGATGKNDAEVISNGLAYAKKQGWNTRYKSLEGGADTIGNNYILKKQDTLYYEKFNVVPNNEYYATYNHQYMQNIQAAAKESEKIYQMYNEAGSLDSSFVFKIPVYKGMGGLKLSKSSVNVNVGSNYTLVLTENSVKVEASKVTWSSSDRTVATISQGVVTGIKPGSTTITATYGGNSVICIVNVKAPIQSIALNTTEDTMRRSDALSTGSDGIPVAQLTTAEKATNHDSLQLSVSFTPANTTDDLTIIWTSSNRKIATVDGNGLVKAVATGDCTITAKAKSNSAAIATCKIHVIAPITKVRLGDPARENELFKSDGTEIGTVKTNTDLAVGQKISLAMEYWPKNTTDETQVIWSSSNNAAATVENGIVTGKSPIAEVTITASITTDYRTYTDTYQLTVSKCEVAFMNRIGNTRQTSLAVGYGETLLPPVAPEVDGLIFVGWYTGRDGSGSRFDENTRVSAIKTVLYPYYEEAGKGFYIEPIGDVVYTGKEVRPAVKVYDSEDRLYELVEGVDYKLTYKNNKNVASSDGARAPYVVVTGKGNYAGSAKATFSIVPMDLRSAQISGSEISAIYSGKTILGTPVVLREGKVLKYNTDYTLSYPQKGTGAYQLPGTYPVVISGKGGYIGSITVQERIIKAVSINAVTVGKISSQAYSQYLVDTGVGMRPEPVLTYKKEPLIKNVDYTLSYSNQNTIGTATITITAVEGSAFTGSRQVKYKIVGESMTKAKVYGLQSRVYTGDLNDLKQQFVSYQSDTNPYVMLKGQILNYSSDGVNGDYTVSYAGSNAGKATVTITGINNYTGVIKAKYSVGTYNAATDSDGRIKLAYINDNGTETLIDKIEDIAVKYNKKGVIPQLMLYDTVNEAAVPLTSGRDYKLSVSRNASVTTPAMTPEQMPFIKITFKENYAGTLTGHFTINRADFADSNITVSLPTAVYKAKAGVCRVTPTLMDASGKKLKLKTDYTIVSYTYRQTAEVPQTNGTVVIRSIGDEVEDTDLVDAGVSIRISIQGTGNYDTAVLTRDYKPVKASIAGAKVKINNQIYNMGKPVILTRDDIVYVKLNGVDLVYGQDYVIDENSYTNHTKAGKAGVVLEGIGDNFGGRKAAQYTITGKVISLWNSIF